MRRKGVPCACDPCKGKNSIRAINNVSPDPNGDFNIKAGTGIAISDGPDNEITIINSANPNAFVEGDNIDLIPSGDDIEIALTQNPVINGTLTVNGDIIQNGAAYETHAEKIYTRDDYIIMRDGAIAALPPGDFSGFQVKLYDGVNDGRLVIDSSGTARVGDVGDEEPLLTRDEAADLTDGAVLKWDAANFKAINEGTVGSDTKPLKSVNGVLTPVTDDLAKNKDVFHKAGDVIQCGGWSVIAWGIVDWNGQGGNLIINTTKIIPAGLTAKINGGGRLVTPAAIDDITFSNVSATITEHGVTFDFATTSVHSANMPVVLRGNGSSLTITLS